MIPFVVDSNVMNYFQQERVCSTPGMAHEAIATIVQIGSIALDTEGQCEAEWLECAGGVEPLALKDWIADMMVSERIQLHNYKCDSMFKELSNIGIPKKDHKWVRLARSVPSNYIVTEDIDLFDPQRKKNCTAAAKEKIKESCKGPAAKYLGKKYNIKVTTCKNVPLLFNPS